MDVIEKIVV